MSMLSICSTTEGLAAPTSRDTADRLPCIGASMTRTANPRVTPTSRRATAGRLRRLTVRVRHAVSTVLANCVLGLLSALR
jgi:hypothetical protein